MPQNRAIGLPFRSRVARDPFLLTIDKEAIFMRPWCHFASGRLNRLHDSGQIFRVYFCEDLRRIFPNIFRSNSKQMLQTHAAVRHGNATIGAKSKLIDGPWYSTGHLLQNVQSLILRFFSLLAFRNVDCNNEKSDHILICVPVRNIVHQSMTGLAFLRPIDAFKCDLLTRQSAVNVRLHLLEKIGPEDIQHLVSNHLFVRFAKELVIVIVGEQVTQIFVDSRHRPWNMIGHEHQFAAAFFQSQLGHLAIGHIQMADDHSRSKPLHASHLHIKPTFLFRRMTRIFHGEFCLASIQHSSHSHQQLSRIVAASFSASLVVQLQIVDPNRIRRLGRTTVVFGITSPRLVHGNDHAMFVKNSDMLRQGIEYRKMKFFTDSQGGFRRLNGTDVCHRNPLQNRVVCTLSRIGDELNPDCDTVLVTQSQFTGFDVSR